MKVKLIWPKCEFQDGRWGNKPIDSFWIECTLKEAVDNVFSFTNEKQIKKARQIIKQSINDNIFFLITKDLNSIQPLPIYYPFSGLWNGYCPFKKIPEVKINKLEELKNLKHIRND